MRPSQRVNFSFGRFFYCRDKTKSPTVNKNQKIKERFFITENQFSSSFVTIGFYVNRSGLGERTGSRPGYIHTKFKQLH